MARILLIDDNPELSDFLRESLQRNGYQVDCLESAQGAVEPLSQSDYAVVLLDNRLPGLSGIELLAALEQREINVPVILMTGYSTCDTAIRAINLGAFDYVIKPDDFQALFRKLQPLIAEVLAITRPAKQIRVLAESPPHPAPGPMLVGRSRPMVAVYKLIGRFARGILPS